MWDATDAATPILLSCAAGCFVLANVIIRQDDAARSRNVGMQAAALVLAAGILPLALFAGVSMGIRIDQYGLAPERIWALVAIIVATTYGVAYWAGLARGWRARWASRLRQANLHLAVATCALALFLALPILDFGGISARNQIARLEAGEVTPREFDYVALRWDFGAAGRRALERLSVGEGEVAELAQAAQAQEERPFRYGPAPAPATDRLANLSSRIEDPETRLAVETLIRQDDWRCRTVCIALPLGIIEPDLPHIALVEDNRVEHFRFQNGALIEFALSPYGYGQIGEVELKKDAQMGTRDVPMRVITVDGEPVGPPFPRDMVAATNGESDGENLLIAVTTTE